MAYDEIQDMGKATDKPKGFVKWSLIAYWTAILGLCSTIGVLGKVIYDSNNRYNANIQKILTETSADKAKMQEEYNKKLEERINRLENVEEKADKVLLNQKEAKK